ncbi:hypothetical protein LTR17_023100 [Elasticomyces elasticus]|nr:hypothetical protein LTR17_023100 [Elasticomyces elasticus]
MVGIESSTQNISFDTFDRYDNARLTRNVNFEELKKEKICQVLIAPVTHDDFVALCVREINRLRPRTVGVVAAAIPYSRRFTAGTSPTVGDGGTIHSAIVSELAETFNAVAGHHLAKLAVDDQNAVTVSQDLSPHLIGRMNAKGLKRIRERRGTMKDLYRMWVTVAVSRGWEAAMSLDDWGSTAAYLHDVVFVPELVARFLREVAHDNIRLRREMRERIDLEQWKEDNLTAASGGAGTEDREPDAGIPHNQQLRSSHQEHTAALEVVEDGGVAVSSVEGSFEQIGEVTALKKTQGERRRSRDFLLGGRLLANIVNSRARKPKEV